MNCFYHQSVVAIGTCKSCGKGLCPECTVDLGQGLACKGKCEDAVKALTDLIDNNIKRAAINRELIDSAKGTRYIGAAFYLLFGLLVLGFVLYRYALDEIQSPDFLFMGIGILFLGFGLIALRKAIQLSKKTP